MISPPLPIHPSSFQESGVRLVKGNVDVALESYCGPCLGIKPLSPEFKLYQIEHQKLNTKSHGKNFFFWCKFLIAVKVWKRRSTGTFSCIYFQYVQGLLLIFNVSKII